MKNKNALTILLYVFAVLSLAYTCYAAIQAYNTFTRLDKEKKILKIQLCLPCATFYRESILEVTNYYCIAKKGGCPILECKKCRYDRCVHIGLTPECKPSFYLPK